MPWALLLRPTVILGLLLALSVGGNVLLFKMRDRALKQVGAVTAQRDQALAAAQQCSDGVAALKRASDAKLRQVKKAMAEAERAARAADLRADATLQTAPAVPGDACASAGVLNGKKLTERRSGVNR